MRLSTFAAKVVGNYLDTDDPRALKAYSGDLFRARFISRLWMRRVMAVAQSPTLVEFGCAMMRLPLINSLAWHIFFGRGSFPDLDLNFAPQPAPST